MDNFPNLEDLSEAEIEALRERLPKNHVERFHVYRKMLNDCREFFAKDAASADMVRELDMQIAAIDRSVRSKVS